MVSVYCSGTGLVGCGLICTARPDAPADTVHRLAVVCQMAGLGIACAGSPASGTGSTVSGFDSAAKSTLRFSSATSHLAFFLADIAA